jgi:Rod binding domain-containing protein
MLPKIPLLEQQGQLNKLRNQSRSLDQEKARLRKATQEFEAFFKHYMLKTMRQTIPEDPLSKDLPLGASSGKDTFTDLFDMEIAKAGSGGKRSLSDILYRSMEKLVETQYNKTKPSEVKPRIEIAHPKQIRVTHRSLPIQRDTQPIQLPIQQSKPSVTKLKSEPESTAISVPKSTSQSNAQQSHDRILDTYRTHIDEAAAETKLDSALIASVIRAESDGDPNAVSKAGAKGLMQLADSTAQDYGVNNAFDPGENIRAGSRFLKSMVDKYKDVKLALAAYNAGPGNVDHYGGIPPFRETQKYVEKVTALAQTLSEKQSAHSPKVPLPAVDN